jgi:hypothetical protein
VLPATVLLAAACGGSSADPTPAPSATDVDAAPPPPAPAPDAGTTTPATDDPGSDVYPAPHHPIPRLKNYGGPVIKAMRIVTVTFTGDANRDAIRAFDDAVLETQWWQTVTRGYGIGAGAKGTYAELDPADLAGKTIDNDKDLKPLLRQWLAAGKLPTPDENTVYALYLPETTVVTLDGSTSCQDFGAYHDATFFPLPGDAGSPVDPDAGDAGPGVEGAFAVMPRCGGGLLESASHEFIEAATDPHPTSDNTYYMMNDAWAGAQGGEAADLCELRGPVDEGNYSLAKSWVNAAADESKDPCQPSDPGEVFFGAALETVTVTNHDKDMGDYDTDGYVILKRGETMDFDVAVFSEAKLPHALDLVVGKRSNSDDPHDVGDIASGVTAKLSRTTGAKNGHKAKVTISASGSAPVGDHPFVVRAILETDDYHSWPAILRIQ